ncbi:MAG: 23S rRNA (adenine(2503)-C(2))-methyltransferase RlmN [Eubacterium sp.]|nr:23S rRNA (adenine(2503)-C(2))-methyltransferase RlmN [Eubacterium sp.]
MKSIYSLTPKAARELFCEGASTARADNIFKDIYRDGAESYARMTRTSAKVKAALQSEYEFIMPQLVKKQECEDSVKYLFRLNDGNLIESVLMRQKYGSSVCVSSQVGCNMGCAFCESGRHKRVRDLTAGEMVSQLLFISKEQGITITNAAVMGIGEPFDNFDAVCDFCDIVTDDNGLAISPLRVTVSTCGIADKITEFAKRQRPCSLAISLHAADDSLRSSLMPINKKYPLELLMKAAREYIAITGGRVLLEYTLLGGVNDRADDADRLSALILGGGFTVNLIEYNPTEGSDFEKSARFFEFYDELKKHNIRVTVRRKFGTEINAACGQLKSANERDMT